jgi:hypothetical protein
MSEVWGHACCNALQMPLSGLLSGTAQSSCFRCCLICCTAYCLWPTGGVASVLNAVHTPVAHITFCAGSGVSAGCVYVEASGAGGFQRQGEYKLVPHDLFRVYCARLTFVSDLRAAVCFWKRGRLSHLTMLVSLHGCGLLDVQLWVSSISVCVCAVCSVEGFAGRCNSPTAVLCVLFVCMYV